MKEKSFKKGFERVKYLKSFPRSSIPRRPPSGKIYLTSNLHYIHSPPLYYIHTLLCFNFAGFISMHCIFLELNLCKYRYDIEWHLNGSPRLIVRILLIFLVIKVAPIISLICAAPILGELRF